MMMKFMEYISINKNIIWQRGVIAKIFTNKFDSIILLGDMKILSNWISILICRIRGKKVTLWTHGIYGNENFLKILFFDINNNYFHYTN